MRILFLTGSLAERGGALRHLLDLVGAMAARGHHIALAAGEGRAERLDEPLPPGVMSYRIRGLASPDEDEDGLLGLNALLAEAQVVHVQNVMNPAALRRAAATHRCIVTVQDHRVFCPGPGKTLPDGSVCTLPFGSAPCSGCFEDNAYGARMQVLTEARRDALRGVRLIALSGYMAEELERAGLPGAVVLPPWVEPGPPRLNAGDGFLVGGRLVAHKGIDLAWSAWRHSGVTAPLRVAGAGRLLHALEGVEALGWLSRSRLVEAIRASRAVLFPSRWQEPFGILGLEAIAQGTPVIYMDSGGVGDWARQGVLRVPHGDVRAFAEAIRAMDDDPDRAFSLGEAGRRWAARAFPRMPILSRLSALFEEVAGIRADRQPAARRETLLAAR